jgi:hypothetical protein
VATFGSNSGSIKPVALLMCAEQSIDINHIRPRGGVVTQRSAKQADLLAKSTLVLKIA